MQLFAQHTAMLMAIMREYDDKARSKSGDELLALRREENAVLLDACQRIKRVLDFQAGEPVEPQTQFGEAVLLPAGGLG